MRVDTRPRKARARTHTKFYGFKITHDLQEWITSESMKQGVSVYRLCVSIWEQARKEAR